MVNYKVNDKKTSLLLCIFLGFFGIHHFYNGKIGKGILYLFTYGLFSIGWIIDIILILRQKEINNNINVTNTDDNINTVYYENDKGESLILSLDDYTVIDLETTGFDSKNDKIIELAAIKIRNNMVVEKFFTLVNPQIKLPKIISDLTGITDEMLLNAPTIDKVINSYIKFIGDDIILGHNINFDINFIHNNINIPFSNDYIDTLEISKIYVKNISNYKLEELSKYFNIDYSKAHRGLEDCIVVNQLYNNLKFLIKKPQNNIDNIVIKNDDIINKKIVIKGKMKAYSNEDLVEICRKNKIKVHTIFYDDYYDIIVLSNKKYQNYIKFGTNKNYYEEHGNQIISEDNFYNLLGLISNKITAKQIKKYKTEHVKAKDITAINIKIDENNPLFDQECVFTGTLEKMSRKEAMQLVANLGGKNRDTVTKNTNYLILGNNDDCIAIKDGKSIKQKKAEKYKSEGQNINIITEEEFNNMVKKYIN